MNEIDTLNNQIIERLKSIYDPEIPVNIYELGLIYDISIDPEKKVKIIMTLTSPNCPVAEDLPIEVRDAIRGIDGVTDAEIEIVFDPPWDIEKISEEVKLELGLL